MLSIVIIMRNEEKTLPRLGASLSEFLKRGGEWIAVDTGSSDKSVEVARSLGATVHEVGDRFRRTISDEEAQAINARFVVEGEEPVVKGGDSLFDYASARNYAASLASSEWIFMPDADEVLTALDLEKIEEVLKDTTVSRLSYDFVFSHDHEGRPAIQFLHSKFYRRDRMKWNRIIHEILQDI